jgi:hypothetical protein
VKGVGDLANSRYPAPVVTSFHWFAPYSTSPMLPVNFHLHPKTANLNVYRNTGTASVHDTAIYKVYTLKSKIT